MVLQVLSWSISWLQLLLAVFICVIVLAVRSRYVQQRNIRRLGGLASNYGNRKILSLDVCYNSTKAGMTDSTVEFWDNAMKSTNSHTIELNILVTDRILITEDEENIKALLTGKFQDFGKGPVFHKEWKAFLGDSIFTTDGQPWHDSRQLIRPLFIREKVADLDLIEVHVRKLIGLMGSGNGEKILLHKLLSRFTLDAATHYLFGRSVDSLDNEQSGFMAGFDEVQRVQVLLGRLGPFRHWYPRKSFNDGLKSMDRFIEPFITQVLSIPPAELESKYAKSETFIHALARYTRDRKVIRDQLVALLLAGRDTTAALLSWLFLELSRNPRVVQKLRDEIIDTLGPNGRVPTYQEIKDMKYLTYTINETLRLYPSVPFNIRSALQDTTLPRGAGPDGMDPVGIPKGTDVGYSTILLHRRRELYPPISETFPYDPHDWVPDRWYTWTPTVWTFIPFNGGPRICIGQQFAMMEVGYAVTRILQEFDQVIDYGNDTKVHADIVAIPAHGVNVGFARSKDRS